MDLTVIIVSFNHQETLLRTIRSLFSNDCGLNFEVFVVDNASTENNIEIIRRDFPRVKLIENKENLGFAAANNQAIARAGGEYVLLLNPDIEVQQGSLDKLVEFMRRTPEAAAAGGRLLYQDGSLQPSCRCFYTLPTIILRRTFLGRLFPNHRLLRSHLMLDWDHSRPRAVDWVVGACLIIRRSVFNTVGTLDERFFMYFEDVDLCYRIKKAGLKTYYVPEAAFIHLHRRDSANGLFNPALWWHLKSAFRFYRKHDEKK